MDFGQLEKGCTFLSSSPGTEKSHLWIIITEQDFNGKVLIVNLTSDDRDQSCIIYKGEHPFIKRNSYINYKDIAEPDLTQLEKAIEKDLISRHAHMKDNIVKKIIKNGIKSDFIKPKYKKKLQKNIQKDTEFFDII